jgi:probable rRNA maturation factor
MSVRRPPLLLRFHNAQRSVRVNAVELERFAYIALALAWARRRARSEIESVRVVSIILVSDRRMVDLHARYRGVLGSTDVLTFQHGEIVISVETARRNARAFGTGTKCEIYLYILHGLLHLCGFDDTTEPKRKRMAKVQTSLLSEALSRQRRSTENRPV